MTEFILVDGSYFCFFRYHALLTWWKNAHRDDPLGDIPIENEIFVEKFKKYANKNCMKFLRKLV